MSPVSSATETKSIGGIMLKFRMPPAQQRLATRDLASLEFDKGLVVQHKLIIGQS